MKLPRALTPIWRFIHQHLKLLAVLLAGMTAGAVWWLYWAPLPQAFDQLARPLTATYLDLHGELIAELPGPEARSHRPRTLAQLGPWLPVYTVAREDQRFYKHPGVDFIATMRALLRGHGGGSTITQQLVKLTLARKGRSFTDKAVEMLRSLQLERRWSKARILEAYLNRIPYGNRLIGAEAAAQAYFGKPASALTQAQALYLAGLPQAPTRLNPWTRPADAASQFSRSLAQLSKRGVPTEGAQLPPVEHHLPENLLPHYIEAVKGKPAGQRLASGVFNCTLDLEMQRRFEQLMRQHLNTLNRADISQAAVVVMDNATGSVRALIGSRAASGTQELNGALTYRNCGSTLKPFLYLSGIERRLFTAATVFPDTADAVRSFFPDYDPHNFALKHRGPVRLREALGNSMNVPAVVALSQLGARKTFHTMTDWGLRFDHPMEEVGAGFILGNVGVRLLDLTSAFSGLARGGLAGPPRLLNTEPVIQHRVASADAVSIITDILCDNEARFLSFGANSPLACGGRVAVKTGTSAGFRDAWAVGFTARHTVGVWVGNFDGRPMSQTASIVAAAPLWRAVIDELQDDFLPEPALPKTRVCTLSGLLPSSRSPGTLQELFLPGTEPQTSGDSWFPENHPPSLPLEYAAWCASADNYLQATVRPDLARLAILTPREGAIFLLSPNLPPDQQQIEFRVNIPNGTRWTLNQQPLQTTADGRVFWPLQEGQWTLEVSNPEVTVTSHFTVK